MGDTLKNLNNYKSKRYKSYKGDLIQFEEHIVSLWENGKIKAPIISRKRRRIDRSVFTIDTNDYVFSTWRSHYRYFTD